MVTNPYAFSTYFVIRNGDLYISGKDEQSMFYAKTHFLTNAILEYAICLDISWQVIWAYIQPSSLEYLMKQEYKKMEKECNRDNVLQQLNCVISQRSIDFTKAERLKNIMTDFDNNYNTIKLRAIYNGIKHHGTVHFKGLGENFESFGVAVAGKCPPMLCRKSYTVEEIENILFDYHCAFKKYFNEIVDAIMPSEYLDNKMPFGDFIGSVINIATVCD